MKNFIAQEWEKILAAEGLSRFDDWWRLQIPSIDTANTGRGGWSSVSLLRLKVSDEKPQTLVVKRQENHNTRSFGHPVAGIPTFEKELNNIFRFQVEKIPTVSPVYFGKQKDGKRFRSVLVTEFLEGYQPLDRIFSDPAFFSPPATEKRNQLIHHVAIAVRHMHDRRILHNCLYPKHIFVKEGLAPGDVRFIDLEKCKWRPLGRRFRFRDLSTLHRRTIRVRRTERLRFLKSYLGSDANASVWKRYCRKILQDKKKRPDG